MEKKKKNVDLGGNGPTTPLFYRHTRRFIKNEFFIRRRSWTLEIAGLTKAGKHELPSVRFSYTSSKRGDQKKIFNPDLIRRKQSVYKKRYFSQRSLLRSSRRFYPGTNVSRHRMSTVIREPISGSEDLSGRTSTPKSAHAPHPRSFFVSSKKSVNTTNKRRNRRTYYT